MQYDAATPKDYLAGLDDDWRKAKLLKVCDLIADFAPEWRQDINYGMLAYRYDRGPALHLNAQKRYVGVYVGDIAAIDPDGTILKGMDCGKSCIRVKKANDLDETGVSAFLERFVALRKAGLETDC